MDAMNDVYYFVELCPDHLGRSPAFGRGRDFPPFVQRCPRCIWRVAPEAYQEKEPPQVQQKEDARWRSNTSGRTR